MVRCTRAGKRATVAPTGSGLCASRRSAHSHIHPPGAGPTYPLRTYRQVKQIKHYIFKNHLWAILF